MSVRIPDLLEVRMHDGTPRLFIDGELFPYGTVEGVTIGPISRREAPNVTLRIVGMRVTVNWGVSDGTAAASPDSPAAATAAGTG